MNSFFQQSIFVALILMMLTSCVSKKKYTQEIARRELSEKSETKLKADLKQTQASLETRNQELAASQQEVTEKSAHISDLNGQLNALKLSRAELENEVRNLQQSLEQLSSTALSDKQKMDAALKAKVEELNRKQQLIDELQKTVTQREEAMQNILNKITSAIERYSADELSVEMVDGKVYIAMSDKLLFQSGSAQVDKRGKEALGVLAGALEKDPDIKIMVEGHTDNVPVRSGGAFKDNWDLSVMRATSVVRILSSDFGMDPHQLTAAGKGETVPKASNETKEGRALNRRTEIVIEPRLDEIYQVIRTNQGNR
jgi:chemotaxis protein MotB